ncbi:MAG: hypothetical protein QOH76_3050 [Thermoleophilaceae bacterium]|jgi:hypothetical protein|nr:hypothetical protein [Thermoleophilaceae bacterium]
MPGKRSKGGGRHSAAKAAYLTTIFMFMSGAWMVHTSR